MRRAGLRVDFHDAELSRFVVCEFDNGLTGLARISRSGQEVFGDELGSWCWELEKIGTVGEVLLYLAL